MKAYRMLLRFLFFAIAILAISCTKEPNPTLEKELEQEPIPKHFIKTGEIEDSSITYTLFEPALHVKGENLYDGDGYEHSDSLFLDVNQDGEYDLRFAYRDWYYEYDCPEDTLSNDSLIIDCFPDAGNSCYVHCLNDIELLSHNSYWDQPFPLRDSVLLNDFKNTVSDFNPNESEVFKVGYTESEDYYWSGEESSGVLAFAGMGNGSWDSQDSHYLAFRFPTSDTTATHGWIQLSCKGTTCIEIYDMAIEN